MDLKDKYGKFHLPINSFFLIYSAAASSMSALKQPTIRVVAIIAEGVPESDTKQLIGYARSNNKVIRSVYMVGCSFLLYYWFSGTEIPSSQHEIFI